MTWSLYLGSTYRADFDAAVDAAVVSPADISDEEKAQADLARAAIKSLGEKAIGLLTDGDYLSASASGSKGTVSDSSGYGSISITVSGQPAPAAADNGAVNQSPAAEGDTAAETPAEGTLDGTGGADPTVEAEEAAAQGQSGADGDPAAEAAQQGTDSAAVAEGGEQS